jgi:hypothetical protein
MSMSNLNLGAAKLHTLVRGLLAAGATPGELLDVVIRAASETGDWRSLGDAAERVVSDIRKGAAS